MTSSYIGFLVALVLSQDGRRAPRLVADPGRYFAIHVIDARTGYGNEESGPLRALLTRAAHVGLPPTASRWPVRLKTGLFPVKQVYEVAAEPG
jgi:hypothetical protein